MIVCGTCGERNPERARFCWNCGARLAAPERVPEERKIVTVLFCDLVGFTAMSDHADPEDVKATLRPYHARMKREIEHFGGTLDKFIGDGALGVFGAPAAHEDDPERAVRTGLRIHEAIAELNAGDPTLRLAVRVGVATGEAVVSYGGGPQIGESVTGDVVNTASRLQSVAPPGGVVVSEATYRATQHAFDYEALAPVTVKGKDRPLRIWRPLASRGRYGIAVDPRAPRGTPFVGRAEEMALLKATYRRAVSTSSAQLVTITGEPGVGKSRLLLELFDFIDEVPELVRWRIGRCPPYGDGVTFWALGEIVKAQAGILGSDQADDVEAKLARSVESLFDDEQERGWVAARLAGLVGASGGAEPGSVDRSEAFTAWRRFLEALADEHPLILVFEDLHWADEAMLAFIDQLVGWMPDLPLLVLCAARPELYERHPDWGGGTRSSTTIQLLPLGERETAMLLSSLLQQAVLPADTQAILLERAGGNPLFAEEFVRMLTDQGWFESRRAGGTGGRSDVAGASGAGIAVPDSIQALVAARLDTVPISRKALLHDAAVVGDAFWDGAIAALSDLAVDDVRDAMHELARKELVREVATSSIAGLIEYAFWHPLIRDVAYGQIPRAARSAKHRAVAVWIERTSSDRLEERAEVLAHHYETALELARAGGGTVPDDLVEATGRALTLAGERAMRLDMSTAETYLLRALELLPPGHAGRATTLVRLAKTQTMAGRFELAERTAAEAIADHRAAGDMVGVGEAMAMASGALSKLGDTARAEAMLDEAREILEREPPGRELARVYSRLAGSRLVASRFAESLGFAERALALATDMGLEDEVVRARQFRGAARCDLGDQGGLGDLWNALGEGLDRGFGEETALCYGNLAYQLWLKEGPEVARQVWSASIEFCEVRGFVGHGMWARAGMLEVLFDLGSWDELLGVAEVMTAWDVTTGGGEVGVFAAFYRASVMGYRQQVRDAEAVIGGFLPAARRIEHPEILAPALYAAMVVEAGRGANDAAADLAQEFGEVTADQPGFRAHYLPGVVRVLLTAGRAAEARGLLIDGSASSALNSRRYQLCLATARAQLAEADGEHERAAELFAAGAEDWREYGFALERGHSLFGRGRCLASLGLTTDATAPLIEARDAFAALSAPGLVERVDRHLGRLIARTS